MSNTTTNSGTKASKTRGSHRRGVNQSQKNRSASSVAANGSSKIAYFLKTMVSPLSRPPEAEAVFNDRQEIQETAIQ